jgi:hypothetical protein
VRILQTWNFNLGVSRKTVTAEKRSFAATTARLKRKKSMQTQEELMRNCTEALRRSNVPDEYEAI